MSESPWKTWWTNAWIRFCKCPGPTRRTYTDGRAEYAHCPTCRQTYNLTANSSRIPF